MMGISAQINIHFSNPMTVAVVPTVEAFFQGGGVRPLPVGTWQSDNQTYTVTTDNSFLAPTDAGKSVTLSISGAQDSTSRQMDGNPRTIAYQPTPDQLKDDSGWVGYEAIPDTNHVFLVGTFSPTNTPTFPFTPTETPTPEATLDTPTPSMNCNYQASYPTGTALLFTKADSVGDFYTLCYPPSNFPDLSSYGYSYVAAYSLTRDDNGHLYCHVGSISTHNNGNFNNGSFHTSKHGKYIYTTTSGIIINSNNVPSISGTCATGLNQNILIPGWVVSGDPITGRCLYNPSNPNVPDQVLGEGFDVDDNYYLLYSEQTGSQTPPVANDPNYAADYYQYLSNNYTYTLLYNNTQTVLTKPASSLTVTPYWSVTINYVDGTYQTVFDNSLGGIVENNYEEKPIGLLDKMLAFFMPDKVYADGSNYPPIFQNGSNLGVVQTNDNRWYVLGPDGQTVYGYDNNFNPLDEINIRQGILDPYKATAMTFVPGPGGGTLGFIDGYGNIRADDIPIPHGYTPVSTYTGTPVVSATATPTITCTPTNTQVPTFTPDNDVFSDWYQAQANAPFGGRSDGAAAELGNQVFYVGGLDANWNYYNDVWSTLDGVNWNQTAPSNRFSPRSDFGLMTLNGTLYLVGGWDANGMDNDVWSSPDGENWSQVTANAPWTARSGFGYAVYNNQLWLAGGQDIDGNTYNDVWNSPDGKNWNPVTLTAPWVERSYPQLQSFNGQLWLMGGVDFYGNLYNDVWSSPDGQNWSPVTTNDIWSPREAFFSGVVDGQLVVMGGQSGFQNISVQDIYHSPDGINWIPSTFNSSSLPRAFGAMAPLGNNELLVGGTNGSVLPDIWELNVLQTPTFTVTPTPTPLSGYVNWIESTDNAAFGPRSDGGALYFNNQYWIIGGANGLQGTSRALLPANDVWNSTDGTHWQQVTANAAFPGRMDFGAVSYNGKMWLLGGLDVYNNKNDDVWYSTDGATWFEKTAAAPWTGRYGLSAIVFNNQMWVIGGEDQDGEACNDAWYTSDGLNWTQATTTVNLFPGRYYHQTVLYNNELWVMGGANFFGDDLNDVWSSTDGANWTEQTANAPWTGREGFAAGIVNGQMLITGGVNYQAGYNNPFSDIWTSPDGQNWTQQATTALFGQRGYAQQVMDNTQMWIMGGQSASGRIFNSNFYGMADVWHSNTLSVPTPTPTMTPAYISEGNWSLATADPSFLPRSSPGLINYQNQLWMIGGTNSDIGPLGEVWNSPDGVNWNLVTQMPSFEEQTNLSSVVFDGAIWVYNAENTSYNGPVAYNSTDGINWNVEQLVFSASLFSSQPGISGLSQVVPFNGKLWGSVNQSGFSANAVSSDGINWTQSNVPVNLAGNAVFTPYNGQLWAMGGYTSDSPIDNNIWSSTDGVNWALINSNPPFKIANGYQGLVNQGVLYLLGLNQGPDNDVQDEWATTDGVHWTQISTLMNFMPRTGYSSVAFNNTMFAIGGNDVNENSLGDIWYSPLGSIAPPTATPTPTNSPTITPTCDATVTSTCTPPAVLTATPSPTPNIQPGIGWIQAVSDNYTFAARGNASALVFNGSLWVMGGENMLSNSPNTYFEDIWTSPDGTHWSVDAPVSYFGGREGQGAVSFAGNMWVIGGNTSAGVTNDVWSSPDGLNWTQVTAKAPFQAREGHGTVVFNNEMFVIGGSSLNQTSFYNDIWYTTDGKNWSTAPAAPFAGRSEFGLVVFNNQLWAIGGLTGGGRVNDVWSSPDGFTWTEQQPNAAFEPRDNFGAVVADGRIWIMGGHSLSGAWKNDVWYSCDGVAWYNATPSANFSGREGNASALFNNAIWVLGGLDQQTGNGNADTVLNGNVWYSPMLGINEGCYVSTATPTPTPVPGLYSNWTLAKGSAPFAVRADHSSVAFGGQMWVIGGGNDQQFFNDTWSSPDGVSWNPGTTNAPFSPRINHASVVFGGKIWVVGGQNFDDSLNADVWSSPDGSTWTEATANAAFGARAGMSLFAADNLLWVAGGVDNNSDVLTDVWNSPDGATWTLVNPNAYTGRTYQTSVYTPNNLFVMNGGIAEDGSALNDTWFSGSGSSWQTSNPANAPFSARQSAAMADFDSLVFVIGGMQSDGTPVNDVWYTANLNNWTESTGAANFSARSDLSSVAFGNRLWVIGGYDGNNYLNDIWYTQSLVTVTPTPSLSPTLTPNLTPVAVLFCPQNDKLTSQQARALAVDNQGNVYFGDNTNDQVDVMTSAGSAVTVLGGLGTKAGKLVASGIAIDPVGKIFISDSKNNRVVAFDQLYHFATTWNTGGNSSVTFITPSGIAVDANENVYLADTGNSRVVKFTNSGESLAEWDGFTSPIGVGVDRSTGLIYISDPGTQTVDIFNAQGVKQPGTIHNQLTGLQYLAVDSQNQLLYVSDGSSKVAVYQENGDLVGVSTGSNPAFKQPEGIAVGNGYWWVADTGNSLVEQYGVCESGNTPIVSPTFTVTGTPTITPTNTCTFTITPTPTLTPSDTALPTATSTLTPEPLACGNLNSWSSSSPTGIAVGPGGIYVGDQNDDQVIVYNAGGGVLGQLTGTNGQFSLPNCIAVDANSNIYLTDGNNYQLVKLDQNGNVLTKFGNLGNRAGQFENPYGVALNSSATTIYVADSVNNRITVLGNSSSGVSFITQWVNFGPRGQDSFNYPTGIAVDSVGNVYVPSQYSDEVDVFDHAGNLLNEWSVNDLGVGYAIAIDTSSNLAYVANGMDTVGVFDLNGNEYGSMTNASFGAIQSIAVSQGNWYVGDSANQVVDSFSNCSANGVPLPSGGLATPTATVTYSFTPTFTPSDTSTLTGTSTETQTGTATATNTMTSTPTGTGTSTSTGSPTSTATNTFTGTATGTASSTATPSNTYTVTSTPSMTWTGTASNTSTPTGTPTGTVTNTPTNSTTATWTNSATRTATSTLTVSPTNSPTATGTNTGTSTCTSTATNTPTNSITATYTNSATRTTTSTSTASCTNSPTATKANTVTATCTNTGTSTITRTSTWTVTNTQTRTWTATPTLSMTFTATVPNTSTMTVTSTYTPTFTPTNTRTFTPAPNACDNLSQWLGDQISYSVGVSVVYGMEIYQCIQANTSTVSWTPPNAADLWQDMGSCTGPTSTPNCSGVAVWGTGVSYALGSKVTYNNELYLCVQAHTSQSNWQPPNTPNLWQDMGACTAPHGMVVLGSSVSGRGTNTPTSTVTYTATVTSTATNNGLLNSFAARPNISRNGVPISFHIQLNQTGHITLSLYTVFGEQVYTTGLQGQIGDNQIVWYLRNKAESPVSSGLYICVVQIDSTSGNVTQKSKVVVIH